jgi:AraC-like DNA-binding protein
MTAGANRLTTRATLARQSFAPAGTVGANELRVLIDAFAVLAYDTGELLKAAGLDRADIADRDARLSCSAYGALLARAQQLRFTPNLALRLAMSIPMGAFPLLDYLVLTSDSVGDAVRQLARYFALAGSPTGLEIRDDGDPIDVLILNAGISFAEEYCTTLLILHMREETEGRFAALRVSFTHSPDDAEEFERVLACPIQSRSERSAISISREVWELPMRRRDPVLRRLLERQADGDLAQIPQPDDPVAEVRRVLTGLLPRGEIRIETVARQLATSPRTLQRRLAAMGVSFQGLVDDVRKEAAGRRVAGSTWSISEIAYLLGYSEPGPFHRAFKRWFGQTPDMFRRSHTREQPGYTPAIRNDPDMRERGEMSIRAESTRLRS